MKINYTQLATLVFAILTSIYLMFLMSCSAKFHQRKFIEKGGKIICDTTVVTVNTTIKGKDGKDSIIYRQVSVDCPELVAPPTRFEIRYRYKAIRDTLRLTRYVTKYKSKEAVKQARIEKRSGWGYSIRFIAVILGLLIIIVYLLRTNK
tara:strand:- start:11527 stop:11973 length:447 start_codon:yes stop_codon:yes gene_type:complete